MSDLTDIIFEFIDKENKYAYGKYGDFQVIIMTENGYINATKMCSEYGKGKQLKHWLENKNSKELIDETHKLAAAGIPASESTMEVTIKITTGSKNETITRGTYVHPLLIPHIASWISPQFALKVSKIVNEYMVQEYKDTIKKKNNIIKKKKGKITELLEKVNKINEQNEKVTLQNEKISKQNDKIIKQNKGLKHKVTNLQAQNDILDEKLDSTQSKLDDVLYHRNIPPDNNRYTHKFVVLKINDPHFEYDYHVIRIQKRSYEKTYKIFKADHPNCEVLLELNYSPNSISLWNRIVEQVSDKFRKRYLNDFNLKKSFSERELLDTINKIHQDRYNIDDESNE